VYGAPPVRTGRGGVGRGVGKRERVAGGKRPSKKHWGTTLLSQRAIRGKKGERTAGSECLEHIQDRRGAYTGTFPKVKGEGREGAWPTESAHLRRGGGTDCVSAGEDRSKPIGGVENEMGDGERVAPQDANLQ